MDVVVLEPESDGAALDVRARGGDRTPITTRIQTPITEIGTGHFITKRAGAATTSRLNRITDTSTTLWMSFQITSDR